MKLALISGWHVHAGDYCRRIEQRSDAAITAVWDENPERGRSYAERLNADFYENYDELLEKSGVEAVLITSPTAMHPELMIKAAKAGKHIFTEKVLAIRSKDAYEIAAAVKEAGIHFTICYPHEAEAPFLCVKQLVESGKLGKLTYVKFRKAHNGSLDNWLPDYFYEKALCGGGAMMDLGAHPMYLLEWLLGKTKAVSSVFTDITGRGVEDNAVSLLEFENGAIGVSETGFVSWGCPLVLEISGTDGWLQMTDGEIRYRARTENGWVTPALPEDGSHPLDYFVEQVKSGAPDTLYTIDEAVALTELMEAAYISAENGTKTTVANGLR